MQVNKNLSKLICDEIEDYSPSRSFRVDLTLTENYLGPSPKVMRKIREISRSVASKYSTHCENDLIELLGKNLGLSQEFFLLTRGASHGLELILRTFVFEKRKIVTPELTFPLVKSLAILNDCKIKQIPVLQNFRIDLEKLQKIATSIDVVYLCNPNNPTGIFESLENIEKFVQKSESLVVVDEANLGYFGESVVSLMQKYHNLIILRSFSKIYGLAGLRIGYIVAHPNLVYYLKHVMTPHSISDYSILACSQAVKDESYLKYVKVIINKECQFLVSELKNRNFDLVETQSNYFLAHVPKPFKTAQEYINILNRRGANVVDCRFFCETFKGYMRIAPKGHQMNKKFLSIIDKIK